MSASASSSLNLMQPFALNLELPWASGEDQEQRFKSTLKKVLIPLLLLFLIVPFLPQFEKEFVEEESDLTVTKLLLEPVPPPPPPVQPPKPKKAEPPKQEKPIPKPKDVVPEKAKTANIKTPTKPKKARSAEKTAVKSNKVQKENSVRSSQGLNELSSQLSSLRASLDTTRLQNKNVSANTEGSVAKSSRQRLGTDQAFQKSGGISVDGSITESQSTTLASRTTTAVDGLVTGGTGPSGNQSYVSSGKAKRDIESIRRTLEQVKSNANTLYSRALLEDPNLAGSYVVNLVIEPDGSISDIRLVSSNLGAKAFEDEFFARIARVNFGAKDVATTEVRYRYNFVPP